MDVVTSSTISSTQIFQHFLEVLKHLLQYFQKKYGKNILLVRHAQYCLLHVCIGNHTIVYNDTGKVSILLLNVFVIFIPGECKPFCK